jgi:hypothetical protein
MPFGNITAQTIVYEPRTPGVYSRTGVTYDQPQNEFRIRGARPPKAGQPISCSVTRVLQKDITVGSAIERRQASVNVTILTPPAGGFTAAEIDSLTADISEFLTAATFSRLAQGES